LQFTGEKLGKQRVPQFNQPPALRVVTSLQDWTDHLEEGINNRCWRSCHELRFKEVGRLEQLVADLEAKQAKLTTELADPATYSQGAKVQQLNADLKATTDALHAASADWEKAAQKLTDAKGA
jgi:hypothetical protein